MNHTAVIKFARTFLIEYGIKHELTEMQENYLRHLVGYGDRKFILNYRKMEPMANLMDIIHQEFIKDLKENRCECCGIKFKK